MKITRLDVNCDNPDCDYTSKVEHSEITDWINKPCPLCETNLLTFDDYKMTCEMIELADCLQQLQESLGVPTHYDDGQPIKLSMTCDRTGHVKITESEQ